jgi:hypothetical protein
MLQAQPPALKPRDLPIFQGEQGHASRFGAKRREIAARLGGMGQREGRPARRARSSEVAAPEGNPIYRF